MECGCYDKLLVWFLCFWNLKLKWLKNKVRRPSFNHKLRYNWKMVRFEDFEILGN